MIKGLIDKIRQVKIEIDSLERRKGKIQKTLKNKKERLRSLEELTVNQETMLDVEGFE